MIMRPSIGLENLWIGMGRNNADSTKSEEVALSIKDWVRRGKTDIEENGSVRREWEVGDDRNSSHPISEKEETNEGRKEGIYPKTLKLEVHGSVCVRKRGCCCGHLIFTKCTRQECSTLHTLALLSLLLPTYFSRCNFYLTLGGNVQILKDILLESGKIGIN